MNEKEYHERMREIGLRALALSYEDRMKRVEMSNRGVSTGSVREAFSKRIEQTL